MQRIVIPELLDSDSGTPQEVAGSLADLRTFNRHLGGVRTVSTMIQEVAERCGLSHMTWLDVAGGAGDVAALTTESLRRSGITLQAVVLDRALSHLNGSNLKVCADALALPFRDASFDIVGSSLFTHHLERDELLRFAGEALRVARHAVVIHDLVRHRLHWMLAAAGRPMFRSRLTRHDALASVRRAYTAEEMRRILEQTVAASVSIRTFFLYRMGAIAWKQQHPAS